MEDTQFMSAQEKQKVLRQWELFLKSECARAKFTKSLYHHLIQHCSFIAHYNIHGFYATYFEEGEDTAHFLGQFDKRYCDFNGIPKSVEYGMTYWATGDYEDINKAMIEVAGKYIPQLVAKAQNSQEEVDILRARALLAKHGKKAAIR